MNTEIELQQLLDEWHSGSESAKQSLLERSMDRLYAAASRQLRHDSMREHCESMDLLQEAMLRITRSLESVKPSTSEQFLRWSSAMILRCLVDLARKIRRMPGIGIKQETADPNDPDRTHARHLAVANSTPSGFVANSEIWVRFYEAVDALPEKEREVFNCIWVQRLSQTETANVLGVTTRTIRNIWNKIRIKLGKILAELGECF